MNLSVDMEKRWHKVWPEGVPKTVDPKKSVDEQFTDMARKHPNKVALNYYGQIMTYNELDGRVRRFATALKSLGVSKGDRVAIDLENCPQFVISFLGTLQLGAIVVPVSPMFKEFELEHVLVDSGAETILAMDFVYPWVEKIKSRTNLRNIIITSLRDFLPDNSTLPLHQILEITKKSFPGTLDFMSFLEEGIGTFTPVAKDIMEDLALLMYTTGTTGIPKGAMITHHVLAHQILASITWQGLTAEDIHLNVLPDFAAQALVHSMAGPLYAGATQIILARFTPEATIKAINKYKCTAAILTTTAVLGLLNWPQRNQYDLSDMEKVISGGAPIASETMNEIRKMLPRARILDGYGLTETCTGPIVTPPGRPKIGAIGIPWMGADVKIVDLETGTKELGPNQEGEIIIKCPMMKGYWNKPEATEAAVKDGWLYTGDIGRIDEEGYVSLLGRTKEMIKASGFLVSPIEVEDLLYKHPAVGEVAVVGVPDAYRGENIKAFIVLKPEFKGKITEEEIISWGKDHMSPYKSPRIVEFREELPKSGLGKILKRMLVEGEKFRKE